MRIDLCDGKYTYILDEKTGDQKALRHGQEWRDLAGDGFILSMAQRIADLEDQLLVERTDEKKIATLYAELLSKHSSLLWAIPTPFKYFCEVDCVSGPNYWRDCHKDHKGAILLYKLGDANESKND